MSLNRKIKVISLTAILGLTLTACGNGADSTLTREDFVNNNNNVSTNDTPADEVLEDDAELGDTGVEDDFFEFTREGTRADWPRIQDYSDSRLYNIGDYIGVDDVIAKLVSSNARYTGNETVIDISFRFFNLADFNAAVAEASENTDNFLLPYTNFVNDDEAHVTMTLILSGGRVIEAEHVNTTGRNSFHVSGSNVTDELDAAYLFVQVNGHDLTFSLQDITIG